MKTNIFKQVFLCVLSLMVITGCDSDNNDPGEPDVDVLVNGELESEYNVVLGLEFVLDNIFIPIYDDVKYYWELDGRKMEDEVMRFEYLFESEGEYILEFTAYRGKYKDQHTTKLIVKESEELLVVGSFDKDGYSIEDGDRLVINAIKAYPSTASVVWSLNGNEIGQEHVLDYMGVLSLGDHDLQYKASYGGKTETLSTKVVVIRGMDYGSYRNVLIGVLPETGGVNDVNWQNITHLYLPVERIDTDGSIVRTRTDNSYREIVARAQQEKVQVLLSLNGLMNTVSGIGNENETTMSNVLIDEGRRSKMISDAITMVYGFKLNGIDLNYTEWQTGNFDGLSAGDTELHLKVKDGVSAFFNEIRPLLSETKLLTLSVPSILPNQNRHDYYDFASMIDNIDWVSVMQWYKTSFVVGTLAWHPTGWYHMVGNSCNVEHFLKWHVISGVPMEKLVLGFPLFGVRINRLEEYFGEDGSWGFIHIIDNSDPFWVTLRQMEVTPGMDYNSIWTFTSYYHAWDDQLRNDVQKMPHFPGEKPGTGYFWDPQEIVDGKLDFLLGETEGKNLPMPQYRNTIPIKGAMLYGLDGDFTGDKSIAKYCYDRMQPRLN